MCCMYVSAINYYFGDKKVYFNKICLFACTHNNFYEL